MRPRAAGRDGGGRGDAHPVKVMIVNMFSLEAAPWLAQLHAETSVPVPGLPAAIPRALHPAGVCQMTIGMGHANARRR